MLLRTNRGAEYHINMADVSGSNLSILLVDSTAGLGRVATDLDDVETFSIFDSETDEYREIVGYTKIITIVRQTDTSYFITLERGDG